MTDNPLERQRQLLRVFWQANDARQKSIADAEVLRKGNLAAAESTAANHCKEIAALLQETMQSHQQAKAELDQKNIGHFLTAADRAYGSEDRPSNQFRTSAENAIGLSAQVRQTIQKLNEWEKEALRKEEALRELERSKKRERIKRLRRLALAVISIASILVIAWFFYNYYQPLGGATALAAGYQYTCALTAGGGVKCWGDNTTGQLGDDTTQQRFTPVGVSGLESGVMALAAGGNHTCALTASQNSHKWISKHRSWKKTTSWIWWKK